MTTITDRQLQSLRNMGCEFEDAANEIEELREALSAPATAPDLSAAYIGAREDLAIWKKRALEAEETARQLTRALAEEVNGPTFMGEPVLPATASAQPEIVDLLAEMYDLILTNKVVLAEKNGGVWMWPDRVIEAVRKHRSGPARAQADTGISAAKDAGSSWCIRRRS